ncbi:MAG: YHYH protein [Actinomycetota bacterium]
MKPRDRTPRRSLLAACLAAILLVAAACGSSDDSTDTGGSGETAAANTETGGEADSTGDADQDDAGDADASGDDDASGEDDASGGDAAADTEPVASLTDSGYVDEYTLVDEGFGTMTTVTIDGGTRTIETNALPDHDTGEFPNAGNPNAITAQDLTWEFPVEAAFTGSATEVRTTGVAVNGVKFEPGTAETVTCSSGETYRIEALQELYDLGLDFNNAHVQPTGEYHYHGISELLVDAYDDDQDLVHIGFAADGYLMYYSKSGAYESSYVLSDGERAGTGCVASGPAGNAEFDLVGTSPDGTYTNDFVYTDGAGDLDACNGTTIDGQYAYIVTDAYPYVSRCLNGEVSGAGVGGPPAGGGDEGAAPGQGGPGQGGGAPDLSEAAATLGVSEDELLAILPGPGEDLSEAAATLGVTVEELMSLLPAPGGAPAGR